MLGRANKKDYNRLESITMGFLCKPYQLENEIKLIDYNKKIDILKID